MISKNMPEMTIHTKMNDFFKDMDVPMWMKLIHFFILVDAKSKGKNGWTIWWQNPNLIKRFTIQDENTFEEVWAPSISSIQKSIRTLEDMGFLIREVNPLSNQRFMKLNRARVIEFLRQNSLDTDLYQGLAARSRERKLIRRKIITVADYINAKRHMQNEQFNRYLNYQARKYGYDVTVPDVDIFEINVNESLFVSREEIQFLLESREKDRILDNLYDRMRTF